jgi:hypothetical protein
MNLALFQEVVVVCGHDQLVGVNGALAAQDRGEFGQELVQLGGGVVSIEQGAQLLVEGIVAQRQGHILGDLDQVLLVSALVGERAGEVDRQFRAVRQPLRLGALPGQLLRSTEQVCAGPEERDDSAGEDLASNCFPVPAQSAVQVRHARAPSYRL